MWLPCSDFTGKIKFLPQVGYFDKNATNFLHYSNPFLFSLSPLLLSSSPNKFSIMLVLTPHLWILLCNSWNPLSKPVIEEFCLENHLKNVRNNPLPCLLGILRAASRPPCGSLPRPQFQETNCGPLFSVPCWKSE